MKVLIILILESTVITFHVGNRVSYKGSVKKIFKLRVVLA